MLQVSLSNINKQTSVQKNTSKKESITQNNSIYFKENKMLLPSRTPLTEKERELLRSFLNNEVIAQTKTDDDLLSAFKNIHNFNNQNSLIESIKKNNSKHPEYDIEKAEENVNIIKLFIRAGGDLNIKSGTTKKTLLMWAVSYGDGQHNNDVIQILINKGADVNAKDIFGKTALMLAVEGAKEDAVQILAHAENINFAEKAKFIVKRTHSTDLVLLTALELAKELRHNKIRKIIQDADGLCHFCAIM